MREITHTVLLVARQLFEAEHADDRSWNRTFDMKPSDRPKTPLSESERESFYKRARKLLQRKTITESFDILSKQ